jgi:hypothetical protein
MVRSAIILRKRLAEMHLQPLSQNSYDLVRRVLYVELSLDKFSNFLRGPLGSFSQQRPQVGNVPLIELWRTTRALAFFSDTGIAFPSPRPYPPVARRRSDAKCLAEFFELRRKPAEGVQKHEFEPDLGLLLRLQMSLKLLFPIDNR